MRSRLDKLLANAGYGSRRDVKRLLRSGAVTVSGERALDPALEVDPETEPIAVAGSTATVGRSRYLMMNKPAGVVTSTDDPVNETVMSLLRAPWSAMGLFPVGRLDLDTEGLLVLTDDGPLTHRLTSPRSGVDKTYYVELRDPVSDADLAGHIELFRSGVAFRDGYVCLPARLARAARPRPGADPARAVEVTIQEGKHHQVKKMMKVIGNEVAYLKRVAMGDLSLDPALAPGEYRELTDDETAVLRSV